MLFFRFSEGGLKQMEVRILLFALYELHDAAQSCVGFHSFPVLCALFLLRSGA